MRGYASSPLLPLTSTTAFSAVATRGTFDASSRTRPPSTANAAGDRARNCTPHRGPRPRAGTRRGDAHGRTRPRPPRRPPGIGAPGPFGPNPRTASLQPHGPRPRRDPTATSRLAACAFHAPPRGEARHAQRSCSFSQCRTTPPASTTPRCSRRRRRCSRIRRRSRSCASRHRASVPSELRCRVKFKPSEPGKSTLSHAVLPSLDFTETCSRARGLEYKGPP